VAHQWNSIDPSAAIPRWVPTRLPGKSVGIGKLARISAPRSLVRRLEYGAPASLARRVRGSTSAVVRTLCASAAAARPNEAGSPSKSLASSFRRTSAKIIPPAWKKTISLFFEDRLPAQAIGVKTPGSREVPDPKRDDADALLHGFAFSFGDANHCRRDRALQQFSPRDHPLSSRFPAGPTSGPEPASKSPLDFRPDREGRWIVCPMAVWLEA
jgi:hypothetical protein